MASYKLGNGRSSRKSGSTTRSTRTSTSTSYTSSRSGSTRTASSRATRRTSGTKVNIPGIGDSVQDLLSNSLSQNNSAQAALDSLQLLAESMPSTLSIVSKAVSGGPGARSPALEQAVTRAASTSVTSTTQVSPMVSALANTETGVGSVLQNKTPGDSSPYVVTYLGNTDPTSGTTFQRDSTSTVSSRVQNPFAGSTRTLSGFSSTVSFQPSSGGSSQLGRSSTVTTSISSMVNTSGTESTQRVSIEFPADLSLRKTVYVYSQYSISSTSTSKTSSSGRTLSGNTTRIQTSGLRQTASPSSIRTSNLNSARISSNSSTSELIETITVTEQLQSTSVTLEIPASHTIVLKYEDGSVLEDYQSTIPSNYKTYDSLTALEKYYLRDFVDQGNYILDHCTSEDNPLRSTFNEYTQMYQSIQMAESMAVRATSQQDASIIKADWDNAIIPKVDLLTMNISSPTSQWSLDKSIVDETDTITDASGVHKLYRAVPVVDGNYVFDYDQAEINPDEAHPGCTFTCFQSSDNGSMQSIDIMIGDLTRKTPMVSARIMVGGEVLEGTEIYRPTTYSTPSGSPSREQMIFSTQFPAWIDYFDIVVRAHADTQRDKGGEFVEYRQSMITYPALYQSDYKIKGITTAADDDGNEKTVIRLQVPFGDLWVPQDQKDPYRKEDLEVAVAQQRKVVSLVVTRMDGTSIVTMGPFMINGNLIQQVTDGVASMTFGDISNAPNVTVDSVNQSTGECIVSFRETEEILEAFDAAAPVPSSRVKYYYNLSVNTIGVDYCLRHSGDSITRVQTSLGSRRKKLYDPWVFEHSLFLKHNTHAPKRQDVVPSLRADLVYSVEPNMSPYSHVSEATTTDMSNALTISACTLYWLYSVEEESSIFLDIQAHPYLEISVQAEMGIETSIIWAKLYVVIGGRWIELAQFHPQANKNKYYDYFTPWWYYLQSECLDGTSTVTVDQIEYQVVYYTSANPDTPYTSSYTFDMTETSGQLFSTFGSESAATDGGLGTTSTLRAAFLDPVIGSFSPEATVTRTSTMTSAVSLVPTSMPSAVEQVSAGTSRLNTTGGFDNTSQSSVSTSETTHSYSRAYTAGLSAAASFTASSSRRGGSS